MKPNARTALSPWRPGYWVYLESSIRVPRKPRSGDMLVAVTVAEAAIRRAMKAVA